jgi:peroxiredoxin
MSLTPSTMLPLGTAAPDFRLPDTSGKTVSLADFKDKPALLVIFMCNHCPYVQHIRAGLAQLAHDYLPRGAAIVGINSNDVANFPEDSPAKMAAEVKAAGYLFPYLYDESQAVAKAPCPNDWNTLLKGLEQQNGPAGRARRGERHPPPDARQDGRGRLPARRHHHARRGTARRRGRARFGRIKFLARLKTYQESLPQDGRIARDELEQQKRHPRGHLPDRHRRKNRAAAVQFRNGEIAGELSLPAAATPSWKFSPPTTGLLLLTGPAGSGKTTTIYACLRHLAEPGGRHIITVEDPVEQIVPGTMQTEVNEAIGLDFARAARHLLRQDPQVLIIGEIRDEATAQLAVRAGLTGHLVISTLHAGSCKGVFERLLVMCADHSAVASAVELVLNQRLIRKLCSACDGAGCECLSAHRLSGACRSWNGCAWTRRCARKSGGGN